MGSVFSKPLLYWILPRNINQNSYQKKKKKAQRSLSFPILFPILVVTIQSQSHCIKIHYANLLEKLLFLLNIKKKKKNLPEKVEKKASYHCQSFP